MKAVIASEFLKARTVRSHWVLLIIAMAFPLVISALVGVFNPEPQFMSYRELGSMVTGTGVVSLLLLTSLWVINLTSEFTHGTIRVTYAAVPARWKVIVSKAIVGTAVTSVVMTVLFWSTFGVGAALLDGRGAPIFVAGWLSHTTGVFVALVALAVIVSWFGLGLGVLIKNSPVAIVVVLLWPLIIENLVALAFVLSGVESARKWMPYQAAIQTVDNNPGLNGTLGRPWAHLYFAAFALVILVIGIAVDRRRDA
jgi:ABC-2 type transport system permease protein